MGVWANTYLYLPIGSTSDSLPQLIPSIVSTFEAQGIMSLSTASLDKGCYEQDAEDTDFIDLEGKSVNELENLLDLHPDAEWIWLDCEQDEDGIGEQINDEFEQYQEITGEFFLTGVSIAAGAILIHDEEGDRLFQTNLMLELGGDNGPEDPDEYLRLLTRSNAIQRLFDRLSTIAEASSWKLAIRYS